MKGIIYNGKMQQAWKGEVEDDKKDEVGYPNWWCPRHGAPSFGY